MGISMASMGAAVSARMSRLCRRTPDTPQAPVTAALQRGQPSGQVEDGGRRFEATQRVLDRLIAKSVNAARLRGTVLKDVLGLIHHDPEMLIAHASHALPREMGGELAAFNECCPRLVSASATADEQKAALKSLRTVHAEHLNGAFRLDTAKRHRICQALAEISMAQLEHGPDFQLLFALFADDEVRRFANQAIKSDTLRFDASRVVNLDPAMLAFGDAPRDQGATRRSGDIELDGATYYCKEIKHGARAAFSEHLATLLNALTGQPTPLTRVGRVPGQVPTYLLSKRVPGYRDIGELLLDRAWMAEACVSDGPALDELAPLRLSEEQESGSVRAEQARERIKALEDRQTPKNSPKRAAPRRNLYEARNLKMRLLPKDIRQMLVKAQFLSRMVGHNDFANGEFCNVGVGDGGVVVTLDFGNALHQGFGGRQRGDGNLEAARSVAYPVNDPYPPSPRLLAQDHKLGGHPRLTRLTGTNVGGIPRSAPAAELVRDAVHAETRLADIGAKGDVLPAEMYFLGGQLEAAFQLSLLPDVAIERLVAREWPEPDDPAAPYKEDDTIRDGAEELAARIIRERGKLVARFRPEDLARWQEKYPHRARDSYNQVACAVAALTGIYIPEYSATPGRDRVEASDEAAGRRALRKRTSSIGLAERIRKTSSRTPDPTPRARA